VERILIANNTSSRLSQVIEKPVAVIDALFFA
jgi:hypothetical protein